MTEPNGQIALATGERAVALGGSATDTFIVTGDNNIISLTRQGTFSFHLLDERFRSEQRKRAPAAFYDGTRPNWANIAHTDDTPRALYADLHCFVEDQALPAQRMALVLGLAGEGKTTLLMRLAWDLAEAGYPVLWRHSGMAFVTPAADFRTHSRSVVLCFDRADDESDLPALADDLGECGVPFVILATARHHEWRNAGLEPALRRALHLQPFALTRLTESEVSALLDRLAAAGKLDTLANLPRSSQVRHFLDRLEADGQLLPAMLTARRGAPSFEAIVEDVLQRIQRRPDGEFLIRAYTLLAAVHRFGYWFSRPLLAHALGIAETEVGPRVLGPLAGELLEVSEIEHERLYTRHPFIAERVFEISITRQWIDRHFAYIGLINALAEILHRDSFRYYERRLLKSLAVKLRSEGIDFSLILKKVDDISVDDAVFWETWGIVARTIGHVEKARVFLKRAVDLAPSRASIWQAWAVMESRLGSYDEARRLFQCGTQANPTHGPVWQAWALMEKEQGNIDQARELFQRGTQADPTHAPTWQAWALMEKEQGDIDRARELFQRGTQANPTHAPTWQAWALVEKEQRNVDKARELFQRGTQADPTHGPTWQAWALMEKEQGHIDQARELFQCGTQADPTNAPTWQAWALVEKEQGNIDRARELFQRGTQADPTHGPSWQAWALMEQEQGNIEQARELFQRGTQADPTHGLVWQAWALTEKEQGNVEQARELFRRGTQADPTSVPTWQAWALMEQQQGNIEQARELFQRGTQADPTSVPTWQAWALMELQTDPARALALLDQALQTVHPRRERATLNCTRGRTLARLRRFPEAEDAFQESLRLDEHNYHTHYFYAADVLEPQGRRDEACAHYRRALKLGPRKPKERQNLEQALRRLRCR